MKKSSGAKVKGGNNAITFFPPSSSSSSLLQNYQQHHGDDDDDDNNAIDINNRQLYEDDEDEDNNLTLGLFNQMKISPSKLQQQFASNAGPGYHQYHAEENDMIRGYGLNSANNYDPNDYQPGFPVRPYYDQDQEGDEDMEDQQDDGGDEMLIDDTPPEMPQQFYEEVNHFLSKPPPSLMKDSGIGSKGTSKKSKQNSKSTTNGGGDPPKPVNKQSTNSKGQSAGIADHNNELLPPIAPQISGKGGYSNNTYPPNHMTADEQEPLGDQDTTVTEKKKRKKVGSKLPQRGTNANKGDIDHNLLHEAFAYTDKLLRDAVMEEQLQQQHALQQEDINHGHGKKGHPRSAPADLEHEMRSAAAGGGAAVYAASSGNNAQGKKKSNGGINAVRNLKKQGSGGGNGGSNKRGDFNIGGDSLESDSRRNPLNFDELVANFQNGTTLEKLRRELADSRNSLAQSESVIRELSGQYLQPKQQKFR